MEQKERIGDESVKVIFTNTNADAGNIFKRGVKIKEKDVIITKNAPYGAKYNKVIDSIWFKIIKK